MFAVYYVVGRKFDLEEGWESPAASLFVGGVVGGILGIFVFGAVYVPDLSSYFSSIEYELGNGWSLASLALSAAEEGLFLVFLGIAAIYIGARRGKTPSTEGTVEGSGGQARSDLEGNPTALL